VDSVPFPDTLDSFDDKNMLSDAVPTKFNFEKSKRCGLDILFWASGVDALFDTFLVFILIRKFDSDEIE